MRLFAALLKLASLKSVADFSRFVFIILVIFRNLVVYRERTVPTQTRSVNPLQIALLLEK